jgi:hypothetical protein
MDHQNDLSLRTIIAYRVGDDSGLRLVPAPASRDWMNDTIARFANRCLPLLVANQAGWVLLNQHRLRVTWNGGDSVNDLRIDYPRGGPAAPALSHFGHGILTWHIPYLFRTPPGYNLWARGPANWPKDGIYPLEGIVETDWAVATFTMNWKMTRPYHPVVFEVDEPICMLVPLRRNEVEDWQPVIQPIETAPELQAHYEHWSRSRSQFNTDLRTPGSEAVQRGWQKDYFQGHSPDGMTAPEHQTKLYVPPFSETSG